MSRGFSHKVFVKHCAMNIPVRLLCWLCVVLLTSALLSGSDPLTRWTLIFFAGLPATLNLKSAYSATELAASSVALSLGVLTVTAGTTSLLGCFSSGVPYLVVILAAAALAIGARQRTLVVITTRDLYASLMAALVATLVGLIYASNGPMRTPEGVSYVARHWLNRDGAYFFALIQQALARGSIPEENPFMAGIPAYYAVLGHCGLALLVPSGNVPAAVALWDVLPLLPVAAAVLFFHHTFRRLAYWGTSRPELWALAAAMVFFVWRPDFFIFPQSQSAFMPLLSWFFWWTAQPASRRRSRNRWIMFLWLSLLACVHTVSSVVALCLAAGASAGIYSSERRSLRNQGPLISFLIWGVGVTFAAALTWYIGNAPFPDPFALPSERSFRFLKEHFLPYLPVYVVGAVALYLAWREKRIPELSALALLLALGIGYTARALCKPEPFSQFFGIFNAQRFPYFGLLLALPLIISSLSRFRLILLGGLFFSLVFAAPQPVRESHLLVNGPPTVFSPADLQLYDLIRQRTDSRARFITNAEHWGLPMFTGRCEFARGPVPVFGLHSLPSDKLYSLFTLRENFGRGAHCGKYWQLIRSFAPVEYILIENSESQQSQILMKCIHALDLSGGRFSRLWETRSAVIYRWISGVARE